MSNNIPEHVFKILTGDTWGQAEDAMIVPRMPIDVADGYVHLSTSDQLAETLALHFKGQSDLVLLAIRTDDIADHLKWEPSRGGKMFPHVYGDVPKSAVASQETVSVDADGSCVLPDGFR